VGLEGLRQECSQENVARLHNFNINLQQLFVELEVKGPQLLNDLYTVEARHLKVQQHNFDGLNLHTLLRHFFRRQFVLSCSDLHHLNRRVERILSINAEVTVLYHAQLSHLLFEHLDIDELIFCNNDT